MARERGEMTLQGNTLILFPDEHGGQFPLPGEFPSDIQPPNHVTQLIELWIWNRRNQTPKEDTWGTEEASKYFGKSPRWINEAAKNGRIPSHMMGRERRFIPSELRDWLAQQPPEETPSK
jgi:excisionase family DNA binding protein